MMVDDDNILFNTVRCIYDMIDNIVITVLRLVFLSPGLQSKSQTSHTFNLYLNSKKFSLKN